VEDDDLDQFWVTTDEESDGDDSSREVARALRRGRIQKRREVAKSSESSAPPEARVYEAAEGRETMTRPQWPTSPAAEANGSGPRDRSDTIRGGDRKLHRGTRSWSEETAKKLNSSNRSRSGDAILKSPGRASSRRGSEHIAPSGGGARGGERRGGYTEGIARLRDLERQLGLEPILDAREAGGVVMRVQMKVERLGIEDGKQREQVARCILEVSVV
jgi:hypothetical protein